MIRHGSAFDEVAGIFFFMEIWKDIKGYEGHYQASSLGAIRSVEREDIDNKGVLRKYKSKILKQHKHSSGSMRVMISRDGVSSQLFVHQLVALAFFDEYNLGRGMQVRHKEAIDNNAPENLRIYTENSRIDINGAYKKRYKGVKFDHRSKKYFAYISVAGKERYIGTFQTPEGAYDAYKKAEVEYMDVILEYKKVMSKINSDKKLNRKKRNNKLVSPRLLKERVKVMKEKWQGRVEQSKNK